MTAGPPVVLRTPMHCVRQQIMLPPGPERLLRNPFPSQVQLPHVSLNPRQPNALPRQPTSGLSAFHQALIRNIRPGADFSRLPVPTATDCGNTVQPLEQGQCSFNGVPRDPDWFVPFTQQCFFFLEEGRCPRSQIEQQKNHVYVQLFDGSFAACAALRCSYCMLVYSDCCRLISSLKLTCNVMETYRVHKITV